MSDEKQGLKELEAVAAGLVERAIKAGASDAEVVIREGSEFNVQVRLGEVETLKQAGARSIGLRVLLGNRSASSATSDFSADSLNSLVTSAMQLAKLTEKDPCVGLPEREAFGSYAGDLHLYDPEIESLTPAERIDWARRAESAALACDKRLTNSDGGSFELVTGSKTLANSRGFVGSYRGTSAGVAAAPVAVEEDGRMQRDGWWSSARRLTDLESPEEVGREAARRTIRRLGARRVPTQQVPLVFAPEVARSLVGSLYEALSGDAIWRGASFLAGKMGEQIATPALTLIDDGTLILPNGMGGFGSRPFDGEGLPIRRTVLIEKGELKSWLLNSYAARKLGLSSTHNAARGLAGAPGIGCSNLYLEAGNQSPQEIISAIPKGLYVTGLMGFGVNVVTGDYSRGATGLWIENGELTHAVEEVTVAGNLASIFQQITAIGNDLEFRGSVASPTLRIDGMTIAGS